MKFSFAAAKNKQRDCETWKQLVVVYSFSFFYLEKVKKIFVKWKTLTYLRFLERVGVRTWMDLKKLNTPIHQPGNGEERMSKADLSSADQLAKPKTSRPFSYPSSTVPFYYAKRTRLLFFFFFILFLLFLWLLFLFYFILFYFILIS